jgi:hypothetical protein
MPMKRDVVHMKEESVRQMFRELLGERREGRALIVFPAVLERTARGIESALTDLGMDASLRLADEALFRESAPEVAAEYWVPKPSADIPPTLILFGAQPWESNFDEDYKIELQAMQNREGLKAAGHKIIFVEWPRGARLDKEVDLTASDLANIFDKSMAGVYGEIRAWNRKLMATVAGVSKVHITCPQGTELHLSVAERTWLSEDCHLGEDEPAIYLPGGEIYVPAEETSAHGEVVFYYCGDKRIGRFAQGILVEVRRDDGSADNERGEEMGVGTEPLCEFGIGTNPWAPPWQIGTIYEKSAGTVHVAVGGNAHFGGERDSPRHADIVIREPSVWLDGQKLALPPALWNEFAPRSRRD